MINPEDEQLLATQVEQSSTHKASKHKSKKGKKDKDGKSKKGKKDKKKDSKENKQKDQDTDAKKSKKDKDGKSKKGKSKKDKKSKKEEKKQETQNIDQEEYIQVTEHNQNVPQYEGPPTLNLKGVSNSEQCDMVHSIIREIILRGGRVDIDLSTQQENGGDPKQQLGAQGGPISDFKRIMEIMQVKMAQNQQ